MRGRGAESNRDRLQISRAGSIAEKSRGPAAEVSSGRGRGWLAWGREGRDPAWTQFPSLTSNSASMTSSFFGFADSAPGAPAAPAAELDS